MYLLDTTVYLSTHCSSWSWRRAAAGGRPHQGFPPFYLLPITTFGGNFVTSTWKQQHTNCKRLQEYLVCKICRTANHKRHVVACGLVWRVARARARARARGTRAILLWTEEERTTMAMDSLHLPDPSAAPHPDSALRLASTVHRFSIVSVGLLFFFVCRGRVGSTSR
jgi:hypothetical protein